MSSGKHPLPAKKPPIGCPGWMMTFGDCMSLLVTFFVMLMSASEGSGSPDGWLWTIISALALRRSARLAISRG